ncbi:MAG: hypothetical protein ACRDMY_15820 [Gaiellaceae bacterium]
MLSLHENLEREGARVAPEPETTEQLVAKSRRPSRLLQVTGAVAGAAGVVLILTELGLVDLLPQRGGGR